MCLFNDDMEVAFSYYMDTAFYYTKRPVQKGMHRTKFLVGFLSDYCTTALRQLCDIHAKVTDQCATLDRFMGTHLHFSSAST